MTVEWDEKSLVAALIQGRITRREAALGLLALDQEDGVDLGLLASNQVAAYLGIAVGTWTGYVSRHQAPEPDLRIGREPAWWIETIDEWRPRRPGPGARTDLKRDEEPGDELAARRRFPRTR